jgi:hypothetical protein
MIKKFSIFRCNASFIGRLLLIGLMGIFLVSCAVSGGYWIPPSAPPTLSPFLPPPSIGSGGPPLDNPAAPVEEPALELSLIQDPPAEQNSFPETQEPVAQLLPTLTPTPEIYMVNSGPILYYSQAADTLRVVAIRFGVKQDEITSPEPIPEQGFIDPGHLLIIPRRLTNTTSSDQLIRKLHGMAQEHRQQIGSRDR